MTGHLLLRDVVEDDLPIFFEHQRDPEAVHMAAFAAKDPADLAAFNAHWSRIAANPAVVMRTIICDAEVVGYVLSYEESGREEVCYWIGKEYWGQGIATWALQSFLSRENRNRPIYARVAKDNIGSNRVLEKCGFKVVGEETGFANGRGKEIEELVLELTEPPEDTA